jgi:hypothetical protein
MAEEFPNGSKVVLKLPKFEPSSDASDASDSQKLKRLFYMLNRTGATFAYKVYGVVKSKKSDDTYSVEWKKYNSPDTIVIDMDRSEIEIEADTRPGYLKNPATFGPLGGQTPNRSTPDEIRAATQAAQAAAAALSPEQSAGKRARKSRKVRKSRKSHKKYRKSRKVRKSRRRARR